MEYNKDVNLSDVPLLALRAATRQILVNELSQKKVIPSKDNLPRDYRGLAHLAGIPKPSDKDPIPRLLAGWEVKSEATLSLLEQFLVQLDRWDVLDDIYELLREDARVFLNNLSSPEKNKICVNADLDNQILVYGDAARLKMGLPLEYYDALLLYADEDLLYAEQIVQKLEQAGCKICLKDNLVGGLAFEHVGVMRLIDERCRRVIVIVSRHFNSSANQFFLLHAHAKSIMNAERIVIPCMYGDARDIDVPLPIRHVFKLYFNKAGQPHYNFWGRLQASVTSVTSPCAIMPPSRSNMTTYETKRQDILESSSSNVTKSQMSCHLKVTDSNQTTCTLSLEEKKNSRSSLRTDHKSSSYQLNLSMHNSDKLSKNTNFKSPKAILKSIFKSKKQKQRKAIAVAM